jgi:DNA-binding FrmR family transcriptional regulator
MSLQEPLDLAAIRAELYDEHPAGWLHSGIRVLCDEVERLRTQLAKKAHDEFECADVNAQLAAMRPVVEEAVAWAREYMEHELQNPNESADRADALDAAVAAYLKAQGRGYERSHYESTDV